MGDFDMNDAVIGFNIKQILHANGYIKEYEFNIKARARGAALANAFAISLHGIYPANVESITRVLGNDTSVVLAEEGHASNMLVFTMIENLNTLLPSAPGQDFYGTKADDARASKLLSVKLIFNSAVPFGIEAPPYNPFIYRVNNRGIEVHLKGLEATDLADVSLFGTFDDNTNGLLRWYESTDGHPFAMEIPGDWKHPLEETSISSAYPDLVNWVTSNGQSNGTWYQNPDLAKCKE